MNESMQRKIQSPSAPRRIAPGVVKTAPWVRENQERRELRREMDEKRADLRRTRLHYFGLAGGRRS